MSPSDSIPDFYTGSPIEPSDLWFREEFIAELWEILDRQHGLLTAPRRTGKTSVMDHLAAFPQHGFSTISVFVQDLDHPGEFILTLLDAFHDRHPNLFSQVLAAGWRWAESVLGRLKEIGGGGFKVALREQEPDWLEHWKRHGDALFEQLRKADQRLLFIVDEFPDFILNMQRHHPELVRPFLGWFRGHRLQPRPKQDPVRWLLGGSVNLSSTLDALGCLDEINDLHDERLPVLTDAEVVEFVDRMLRGRGVELEDGFPIAVAARIGRPVPLFLQMITQDLYRIWKRNHRPLVNADLDTAYGELLVSSAARDKLQHYYSRIAQYYDEPKRSAAYEILSKLSVCHDGIERTGLSQTFDHVIFEHDPALPTHERKRRFNQLLRDLENDFYIAELPDGRFDFASGLLKDWWRKYYA
ncbi:MAG: hypothetical protein R3F19_22650 [Verrucomicrobiales bacterium]